MDLGSSGWMVWNLDSSHGVVLNVRRGKSTNHFHVHFIGWFHSPNPTAKDFEEGSPFASHAKGMRNTKKYFRQQ